MRHPRVVAAALITLVVSSPATAQLPATGTEVRLWGGPVPLATGTGLEDTPALTVYRPAPGTATGAAVVVLPGGGYRGRAAHEGEPVARWLATVGVTAFVARYRVSPYQHPAPLFDARRAIRYVRAHASEWGLDGRVGILGFSAGGHLASTAATQFTEGDAAAVDPVERVSSRPDVAVLIYPVITFTDDAAVHKGSRTNLLGAEATPEQMAALSSERQRHRPHATGLPGAHDRRCGRAAREQPAAGAGAACGKGATSNSISTRAAGMASASARRKARSAPGRGWPACGCTSMGLPRLRRCRSLRRGRSSRCGPA